jgi:hypothetical protein
MAASAQLHCCVHPEAGQPSHQCVATVLAQGQADAAPTAVSVAGAVSFESTVVVPADPVRPALKHPLPPGCAPPALPA